MMDDLISRQAAIGIIQSMYPGMPRIPWMRKDWQERYEPFIRTENAIRELPSAQPRTKCIAEIKFSKEDLDELVAEKVEEIKSAQPEIIRCEDCRWWEDISSNTFAPEYHMCKRHVMTMTGMDFCSRAERRTNG